MQDLIGILTAFLVLFNLSACSLPRMAEALDLVRDIGAPGTPSTLKRRTAEPTRTLTAYNVDGKPYIGDIYQPGGNAPALAATVIIPGVVKAGKDDPRLVAFATSFARVGFVVLVPDIVNLRALAISAKDAQGIGDAVRYLASAGGFDGPRPVGMIAFSYAAGPALIAAMEPNTRTLVRFVYVVGPYYDIQSVVTFFTTGHYRRDPDHAWTVMPPNPYAKWVFLQSNAARVENVRDRTTLNAIAARKLDDADAEIADLARALGPEGQSVYALLANTQADRVEALLMDLPIAIRQEMMALDLSQRDFTDLEARLIVIHGRDDTMIPFTESLDLARATKHVSEFYLIDNLAHVDPTFSSAADIYKLWRAVFEILTMRDEMPAPNALHDARSHLPSRSTRIARATIKTPPFWQDACISDQA